MNLCFVNVFGELNMNDKFFLMIKEIKISNSKRNYNKNSKVLEVCLGSFINTTYCL